MSAYERLEAYDIPMNSPNAAVAAMKDQGWFQKLGEEYKANIELIAGSEVDSDDERELNYTFRYLVTNLIEKPDLSGQLLVDLSLTKARTFIANHSYVFAVPEEDAIPKLDAAGNPKPKKGAKKEMAKSVYAEQIKDVDGMTRKRAIEILVAEVCLTAAGASTYYANLKKGKM